MIKQNDPPSCFCFYIDGRTEAGIQICANPNIENNCCPWNDWGAGQSCGKYINEKNMKNKIFLPKDLFKWET